jgi:putative salt-induced outer membrane protein YdiY
MRACRTRLKGGIANLAFVLTGFALAIRCPGADEVAPPAPLVVTNYVLVTNVVVVTVTNQVLATNIASGANSRAETPAKSDLPDLSWVPPTDDFDWIQLKSGEWLKGRIKAMQEREIEFDSEELNDLSYDWKDIRQLRSPHTLDVLFVGGKKMSGPVMATPEQIVVFGGVMPLVFPRDGLQSLTRGGKGEVNYWSGRASAGLTFRAGNTEQVESSAQVNLQRRTPGTRFSLDYIGNISSTDGVESANNHRASAEFDLWLSRRFYLVLPDVEYYKDPFQNLTHRITLGLGAGYDLVDRPNVEWSITAGPAYQQSWFDSSQPGEPTRKGSAALTFSTHFKWDITRRVKVLLDYSGQYTSREVGETTHHSVNTLSIELTKRFDLDVTFTWDRISSPKTSADGTKPKPDDFRLVVGLGVDF